jgi:hypothetical protein
MCLMLVTRMGGMQLIRPSLTGLILAVGASTVSRLSRLYGETAVVATFPYLY